MSVSVALSMAESRKQKVLRQVERQRKQRTILTFTIVAVLIAVIVLTIIFLPRPSPNAVNLPDYLSHCVTGNLVYHSHPNLVVTISGIGQTLPVTFDAGCPQPIHTHTSDGVLHVETDQNMNYTVGDWFTLWGHAVNNVAIANLNSTLIFGHKTGPGHTLNMTVNGSPDMNPGDFKDHNPANIQNLFLWRNAQTGQNQCTPAPCVPFNIVLTYT
jgi:branched-subunit amino acid transport protein